jgi:TRAP-type mannitol/chloroaromatic compound transport system permease small subunit
MTFVARLEAWLDRLVTSIGRIACWLFIAMMLLITIDVIGRRFLALPTIMIQELEWYLHTILFMLTIGLGYLANAHVRIDILSSRLSERARHWVEILGCLFFMLPYTGLLIFQTFKLAVLSYGAGERSMSPEGLTNVWLIKAVLPLGFTVIFLAGVVVMLRSAMKLANGQMAGAAPAVAPGK